MIARFCHRLGLLATLTLCGCSTEHYRDQADKDVYAILSRVEKDIFGQSSDFTIESKHSSTEARSLQASDILGERSSGEKLRLDLNEALNYAVKNSREYQSQKEQLYLTALTLTGEQHRYRPNWFGGTDPSFTRQSDGEQVGRANTRLGWNQALATGGTFGLSLANDLLQYFTGDPRRSATSLISVNLAQPLLRGAGQDIALENLTQANRNVVYAIRDYTHFQNTFSVGIVNQYFDLLRTKDVIFNEFNNYESRKENVVYLRERADRERPESVGIAEQDELSARNRYISAITNYRNALDRFKVTLGLPQTTRLRLNDAEIIKLRAEGLKPLAISNEEAFRLALSHRLPLFNQIDRFEDRKRQVSLAANQLKTDLSLVGDASLTSGDGPIDYTKFNFDDVRATVGLQLDLPLDRLRERNQYRATLINFEAAIRELGQNFDELRNLLDRRLRELEEFRQSYEIQKGAVELARQRVEGNQLRLQAGTVEFRQLSESQDDLVSAQNAVTSALVNYLGARLGLLVELGVLNPNDRDYWLSDNPSSIPALAPPSQMPPAFGTDDDVPTPEELFE
ncbi:TolC family protein [Roseibacillus ishigakijimensis]|uniref:TolC family protein n=1 Tax=Roseibacillus ishigakijimensis TaxID=454146 RepID=A0A934RQL3_9BACT|nr:TolC family protein [Roseibacillus ishigakijimensis]MBK1832731.1 TolC family protein [Roseibacillus ishigakijimensis]